jgi:hypothetical protein
VFVEAVVASAKSAWVADIAVVFDLGEARKAVRQDILKMDAASAQAQGADWTVQQLLESVLSAPASSPQLLPMSLLFVQLVLERALVLVQMRRGAAGKSPFSIPTDQHPPRDLLPMPECIHILSV